MKFGRLIKNNYNYKLKSLILTILFISVVIAPHIVSAQEEGGGVGAAVGTAIGSIFGLPGTIIGGLFGLGMIDESVVSYVASILGTLLMQSAAAFLGLAGVVLDFVINFTVVQMGQRIATLEANGDGLTLVWTTFRDLANMGFIFILLYIAIGTMLDLGGVNLKKALRNIIIVALLINFSLFFTKVVIDASNIVALGFYNGIERTVTFGPFTLDLGLSGIIMQQLGLTSIWEGTDTLEAAGGGDFIKVIVIAIMAFFFMIIAGFVFFAAAIMFISRYISLVILMMLSPLAFASMALPGNSYGKKWWSSLIKHAVFAPAFFIMIWASIKVFGGILQPNPSPSYTNLLSAEGFEARAATIMNFVIVMGMMIASLVVAQKFGIKGGKWGISTLGRVGGFTARNTIGRTAAWTDKKLESSKLTRGIANSRVGREFRAMTTQAVTEKKMGTMSWKADRERLKKMKGEIEDKKREWKTLADIETGGHAGQEAILRMSNKEVENMANDDKQKILDNIEHFRPDQIEHLVEKSALPESVKEEIRAKRFERLQEEIRKAEAGQANEVETIVKGLTGKEIELMDSAMLTNQHVVEGFKSGQFDDIQKSNKFTSASKQNLKNARERYLQRVFTGTVPAGSTREDEISKAMRKIGKDQIPKLHVALLTQPGAIERLDVDILKKLPEEKTPEELHNIGVAIRNYGRNHPGYKYVTSGPGRGIYR